MPVMPIRGTRLLSCIQHQSRLLTANPLPYSSDSRCAATFRFLAVILSAAKSSVSSHCQHSRVVRSKIFVVVTQCGCCAHTRCACPHTAWLHEAVNHPLMLSCIKAGLQYSFSSLCSSTHTKESVTRSPMTATARARSHCKLICSIDTLT